MANILLKALKESFTLLKEHRANVVLVMLSDIFFLFLSLLTWGLISRGMIKNYDLLQQLGGGLELGSLQDQASVVALTEQIGVMQGIANKILFFIALAVVLLFVYYGFFMGLNWLITRNMLDNKSIFAGFNRKYVGRFYILALFWNIILAGFVFGFGSAISQNLGYGENMVASLILLIFVALFIYFMTISFSTFLLENKVFKSIKDAFKLGIRRFYIFMPAFFVIFIVAFIGSLIINLLAIINVILWLVSIIGIFLLFLIIAWARLYVLLVVKKYLKCG